MSFSFLHSEFFFWMVLPAGALFYFWQTQKPLESRWLGEETLRKLRAPEITMGLRGRNTLFLTASILLIAAMAQPVLLEPLPMQGPKAEIVFAIQTGTRSDGDFERVKELAIEAMGAVAGNDMAVVAFDEGVYLVAPLSDDLPILSALVRNLPRTAESSDPSGMLTAVKRMEGVDTVAVVAAEKMAMPSDNVILLDDSSGIGRLADRVRGQKEAQRLAVHTPLFYYPLGLAMVLILIALSSMSKRRSIGVAALMGILCMSHPSAAEAGFFDFALLHEANEAYERGEYSRSAALFGQYQQSHDTAQIRYNRANALYKAGRYQQAEFWYRHVYTDDVQLEEHRRFNLDQTRKQIALIERKDGAGIKAPSRTESEKNRHKRGAQGAEDLKTRLFAIP